MKSITLFEVYIILCFQNVWNVEEWNLTISWQLLKGFTVPCGASPMHKCLWESLEAVSFTLPKVHYNSPDNYYTYESTSVFVQNNKYKLSLKAKTWHLKIYCYCKKKLNLRNAKLQKSLLPILDRPLHSIFKFRILILSLRH